LHGNDEKAQQNRSRGTWPNWKSKKDKILTMQVLQAQGQHCHRHIQVDASVWQYPSGQPQNFPFDSSYLPNNQRKKKSFLKRKKSIPYPKQKRKPQHILE
jgi:hypothetical protein